MHNLKRIAGWMAPLVWALLTCSVSSGANLPIAVAPVVVKMNVVTTTGAVEVTNAGTETSGLEAEVVRVTWVNGVEQYEATDQFIVTPPAFRLQGEKSRLIRFKFTGLRRDEEQFYRLFVRQLPQAEVAQQIGILFNVGVPIFIEPTTVRPALKLVHSDAAQTQSMLYNTGNVTLTVFQVEGKTCSTDSHKWVARISPLQKARLPTAAAQCATTALTDRGVVAITAP